MAATFGNTVKSSHSLYLLYYNAADNAKLSVMLNKTAENFFKTDVPFPYRTYQEEDACLEFYVAYVRGVKVMKINCLKTNPHWMTKLREYIGWLPLTKVRSASKVMLLRSPLLVQYITVLFVPVSAATLASA